MKQFWCAVLLLGSVILLLLWNGIHLNGELESVRRDLEQACQAAEGERWQEAEIMTRKALAEWREKGPYLYAVQSHRDVDEITMLLEEAIVYLKTRNLHSYTAMNTRARHHLHAMGRAESLHLYNLL